MHGAAAAWYYCPMNEASLMRARAASQRVSAPLPAPADVVRHLCAVQAQDYRGGLWAVGLRTAGAVEASIEEAISGREIVRTWPMRGTLHLVAAEDVWWMLQLLASRALAGASGRHRQLGLSTADFSLARKLLEKSLRGCGQATRDEVYALLERGGVSPEGQRGIHIIGFLAHQGVLCHGPRKGKQFTFVLLEEWVPRPTPRPQPRDEALSLLAARYFRGHGPASLKDFAWWAGITARDAQIGIDGASSLLEHETMGGTEHWSARGGGPAGKLPAAVLLPPFDELLVGYADRSAAVDPVHANAIKSMLSPVILVRGRVEGTWTRTQAGGTVQIVPRFFSSPDEKTLRSVRSAARRYGDYLGAPAVLVDKGEPR